jgi:uncharacterized protein YciI
MHRLAVLLIALVACSSSATSKRAPTTTTTTATTGYDAALAQRLGADEYGMHPYVIAFLKEGPNRTQSDEERKRLMIAHLENIQRMAAQGTLVVAGPFTDDGPLAGLYIFNVKTVDEARALTATDPAIQAGRLEMELHAWYGSAGLQELNAIHKRIEKTNVTDAVH